MKICQQLRIFISRLFKFVLIICTITFAVIIQEKLLKDYHSEKACTDGIYRQASWDVQILRSEQVSLAESIPVSVRTAQGEILEKAIETEAKKKENEAMDLLMTINFNSVRLEYYKAYNEQEVQFKHRHI